MSVRSEVAVAAAKGDGSSEAGGRRGKNGPSPRSLFPFLLSPISCRATFPPSPLLTTRQTVKDLKARNYCEQDMQQQKRHLLFQESCFGLSEFTLFSPDFPSFQALPH